MDDILTVAEMKSRFVAEWVLVEDPQLNDALEVHSGVVRHHTPHHLPAPAELARWGA